MYFDVLVRACFLLVNIQVCVCVECIHCMHFVPNTRSFCVSMNERLETRRALRKEPIYNHLHYYNILPYIAQITKNGLD